MKTHNKDDSQQNRTSNYEEDRNRDRAEKVRNEQNDRRQRSSAESDLEKSLSRGYFPDGPGGNYSGV